MKSKKGNTVLTLPFVIVISFLVIIVFGIFTINMILPFVWYQKLQLTSNKYMYIIEKYGYLTEIEKNNLIEELVSEGFNKDELEIETSSSPKGYGNPVEFNIMYNYKQKLPSWKGSFEMKTKDIKLNVRKVVISKV